MSEKRFPIHSHTRKLYPDFPASVPWAFVEAHAEQAYMNHHQTLERLAERGGLCASELLATVTGRNLHTVGFGPSEAQNTAEVLRLIRGFGGVPVRDALPGSRVRLMDGIVGIWATTELTAADTCLLVREGAGLVLNMPWDTQVQVIAGPKEIK